MAVIIEEMKMPENCGSCDFNHGYRCTRTRTVIDRDSEYQERLPDCPLHEVKMGQWIVLDDCEQFIVKCSVCGRIEDSRMISNYPYCRCGARMQGSKGEQKILEDYITIGEKYEVEEKTITEMLKRLREKKNEAKK